MTRAPRIVVEVDDKAWAKCCASLGLTEQKIRWRRFPPKQQRDGRAIYGQAQKDPPVIFMYLTVDRYDSDRFRDVQRELVITLLHELRHMYQFKTWTKEQWAAESAIPYAFKASELDAERWAKDNLNTWLKIARCKRVFASPLGKVSDAQRRVVG